jgi:hypothetical protein
LTQIDLLSEHGFADMTYFADGFLSETFEEFQTAVRERYATYRELLIRLNKECVEAQYHLPVNPLEPRDLLGATLFIRTIATSQAAVILLERGLTAQAKSVLRSALESLFALAAIEAKPELALPLAKSQNANKRSLADKILHWKGEELKASISKRASDDLLRELVSDRAREFNTAQLADAAGMMDWYYSIYALLSFPAHASVSDLLSHLVVDANGRVTELTCDPELENQQSTWAFTIQIQIRAASAITGIFGVKTVDVQAHTNAFRKICTDNA